MVLKGLEIKGHVIEEPLYIHVLNYVCIYTSHIWHLMMLIYMFFLTDMFTQLSDASGALVKAKFEAYLREILALPTAVFEGPSFGYNDTASRACFDMVSNLAVGFEGTTQKVY